MSYFRTTLSVKVCLVLSTRQARLLTWSSSMAHQCSGLSRAALTLASEWSSTPYTSPFRPFAVSAEFRTIGRPNGLFARLGASFFAGRTQCRRAILRGGRRRPADANGCEGRREEVDKTSHGHVETSWHGAANR